MTKTGTVKWFNDQKGYGFIVPDDPEESRRDVFVHQRNIKMDGFRTLVEGQRVSYDLAAGPDGRMQAMNVVPQG